MCERNNVDTARVFSHIEGAVTVVDTLTGKQTHIIELFQSCNGCGERCHGFIHWTGENRWSGLSKQEVRSYEGQIVLKRQERDHLTGGPF